MKFWFALTCWMASLAWAHDNSQLGKFLGDDIEASYSDHALAGRVGEILFYASPLKEEFGTKLIFRVNGSDEEALFRKVGDDLVGTLMVKTSQGNVKPVVFTFARVDRENHKIYGALNDIPFELHVSAKEMDGHHYVNPEFEVVTNGRSLAYRLENGKVCLGCIIKTSFAILSLLKLGGKI